MMKHISILGSTGSIGTQTLDVVRTNRDIKVEALAAGKNVALLLEQIKEFQPRLVCVYDAGKAKELEILLADSQIKTEVMTGMEGLLACATIPEAEMVVTAFVGMIGIRPTIEAIKAGKEIALANKETLVTAGHIIMPLAQEKNVAILPVDSEHSAIFQSLQGNAGNAVHRILLTASGGPFRGKSKEELQKVQVEDALKHPNWTMGRKITIDSSTLVNKGLEVIEAKWLFGVEAEKIEVVVHPQSIIHSMIEYEDGAVIAQLGTPDMKLPIQYALYYPERKGPTSERLDFYKLRSLEFYKPDTEVFPALSMAYEALQQGGSMPTVYNAANEWAVAAFLDRKIRYTDIVECIRREMAAHAVIKNPSLEEILATEQEVYRRLEK
ncbi:MAG: 1-deoxy-D-xylulose-5-phosphate reductoisomerase [Lachnospiraceae bacterium]|nr:1-deoxy-D-xylulose-5-phosphate reductoisomerase [Lachnospiraceae bacterium]